jgi:hypothetical protein
MSDLTPLQAHVLAYYLDHSAKEFSMTGRWFPHSELDFIFADKIKVDVRQFGKAAQDAAKPVATFYLDHMIAAGGFENKAQKFGGTMHQYDAEGFNAVLAALKAGDAVLAKAAAGGDDFWQTAFAGLTN